MDLDPLRLKVVGGQFVFNNTTKRYESSGTVQIGLKNGSFPLLSVNGSVSYDNQTIKANGIFSPTIGGLTVPLYEGNLEFDVGKAVAKSVKETTQSVANQFKLAGTEVQFTNLGFTQKGIELEGTLQFPPELFGGTKLDIRGNNKILISKDGVSLTGAKIDFPDVKFSIADLLEVKGTGLALGYTTQQRPGITLQGKAELVVFDPSPTPTPTPPFTVTADFADPNYIKVNRDFSPILDVKGSFSLDNIKLVPKVWEIRNAKLSLDTEAKEVKGEGTMLIPTGIELSGGLGFVDKKLNFVKIGGSKLNKPIGATGAFLQSISGQVNNLTKPELIESSLTNVGVTAGPKLTISLPSWAGGDVSGTAVELNASGSITRDRLKTNGTIKIAGGLVEGKGEAELNWNKKFFNAEADFSMLGGVINTKSKFTADKNFNIMMGGAASVKVPDVSIEIPKSKIFGQEVGGGKINFKGQPLAQAEFALNYSNDNNLSNDFVQAYGKLPPIEFFNPLNFREPIKIESEATIKVSFDGKAEASVGKPVPRTNSSLLASSQIERVASSNQLEASADKTASAIQGFTVAPGTPWIILNANWDNATPNTPVEIKAPNGAIFKESDFTANKIAVVDALTSTTTKAVVIANPQPGIWDINLTNSAALGTVEYSAFEDSQAPTVQVTAPSKDVSGQNVTINYNAFDADSTAKVSLFYDTDNKGFDGILIKGGLEEKDGAGNFVWNTQGLPTGDYYVYAMAMDENNAPVFSYAPLPIKVTESADLSVTKTADRDTAIPGSNLTYTVAVTNNGTDNAKGAILTETLPEGAKFVSANITPTKQSGNELTFDLGDVAKGQISTVSITVTAPTTGNITGTSSITSKTYDPDISNDFDFASTTVTNDGTESATDNVVATPTPTPPRPPLRQVLGTPENDNLVGIDAADSIAGFAGDDTLAGLGGDDIIYGNKGNDILTGNSGNDNIFGGRGNDLILGGTNNDRLKGNEGDDTLSGDLGRDILIGGPGSDTFVLPKNAAVTGDILPDAILDFQLGADKIGLTEGLTESNLLLNFELGNTVIKIAGSNQTLGVVVGVTPTQLSGSFVSINLPLI
ncbi:MAG: calcium-binding protein [Oscillatoriales cyanobacterium]|nr:MAG: calcium-binding protein [Oscillatoriales cyanobacterium]